METLRAEFGPALAFGIAFTGRVREKLDPVFLPAMANSRNFFLAAKVFEATEASSKRMEETQTLKLEEGASLL